MMEITEDVERGAQGSQLLRVTVNTEAMPNQKRQWYQVRSKA